MAVLMEVIEWFDPDGRQWVQRIPEEGSADIKMGGQLIVRESQAAVFFRDGKGLDVFGPGRHTLSSLNLPILTRVLSLPWGFTSPFRTEVYFVNQKVFTDLKWGTKEPVVFKDKELGLVRLRAFGIFTARVTQPLLFICPRCGENVTALAKFCPACGTGLSATLTCGHCKTVVPPGTKYCMNCGEAIAPQMP